AAMWVWNLTASAPAAAMASMKAWAMPRLPSWAWATSPMMVQGRPGTGSLSHVTRPSRSASDSAASRRGAGSYSRSAGAATTQAPFPSGRAGRRAPAGSAGARPVRPPLRQKPGDLELQRVVDIDHRPLDLHPGTILLDDMAALHQGIPAHRVAQAVAIPIGRDFLARHHARPLRQVVGDAALAVSGQDLLRGEMAGDPAYCGGGLVPALDRRAQGALHVRRGAKRAGRLQPDRIVVAVAEVGLAGQPRMLPGRRGGRPVTRQLGRAQERHLQPVAAPLLGDLGIVGGE